MDCMFVVVVREWRELHFGDSLVIQMEMLLQGCLQLRLPSSSRQQSDTVQEFWFLMGIAINQILSNTLLMQQLGDER